MSSEEAEAHKAKGNDAFKAKDFDTALAEYSAAIELDPDNHVLYSNRSGAYASLKKYKDAISDAEDCIRLKRTWAKGYSRKATALVLACRFGEAKEAYTQAIEFETDATKQRDYEISLKSCESGAKRSAGLSSVWQVVLLVMHTTIIVLAPISILPLAISTSAHFLLLRLSVLAALVGLLRKAGRPSFNMAYAQKLAVPETGHLFSAGIFLVARPFFIFTAIPLIRSGLWVATWAAGRLPSLSPSLWEMGEAHVRKMVANTHEAIMMCGFIEVMIAIVMLLELLTPMRNFAVCFMQWQYLRMRYMSQAIDPRTTQETVVAFSTVRERVNQLLGHRFVPALVLVLFNKLADYIATYVDPQAQMQSQEKMSSYMPKKCSVM